MKRNMIRRTLLGIPLGIAIGYVITIVISLVYANGYYACAVPELIESCGNEINAVVLQAVLCGILGGICALLSIIWEIEHWSILKQTFVFFAGLALTMLPIAYVLCWMEHTLFGFLCYTALFFMIFVLIWLIQYMLNHHRVAQFNRNLK